MIESAEEFNRLRESDIPEDYHRAAHEQASVDVWVDVLNKYPELAFWVVHNKTVPLEILTSLSAHQDSGVRDMVARKRKIPEALMLELAKDHDDSVRHALASNGKVTLAVLKVLSEDPSEFVRERAKEKLLALTKTPI